MTFFLTWLAFTAVQIAATISPGPAFVMCVRNSLTYNRPVGIATAIGLGLGVAAHVTAVLLGLSALMAESVVLYNIIKYAGAAYLIYIGVKGILAKKQNIATQPLSDAGLEPLRAMSLGKAVQTGFLTNLLNPKAVVFFTAIFTQFLHAETPGFMLVSYGMTSILVEMGWFSMVAVILTNPLIKQRFMGVSHWIERVCGGLMIALGVRLALSKL